MDGNGILPFKKEVAKLLIGPFVDGVENAQGHELMLARQRFELGSTPGVSYGEALHDRMPFRIQGLELALQNGCESNGGMGSRLKS
ncbi:MAG TPA: hypothetical protein VEH04_13210 [Verrucomicrobiae bacterium]|nr:hypothetical protein [Verrucomicrobiae bacterium]